jgi:hypothetical protein
LRTLLRETVIEKPDLSHRASMKHFVLSTFVLFSGCLGQVSKGTDSGDDPSSGSSSSVDSNGTPQQCRAGETVVYTPGQDGAPPNGDGSQVVDLTVVNGTVYFTYHWIAQGMRSGVGRVRPGAKPELRSEQDPIDLYGLSVLGGDAYVTRSPPFEPFMRTIRVLDFANPNAPPRDIAVSDMAGGWHAAHNGHFYHLREGGAGFPLLVGESAGGPQEQFFQFDVANMPDGITIAAGAPVVAVHDDSVRPPVTRVLVTAANTTGSGVPTSAEELANLGHGGFVSGLAGDDEAVYGLYDDGNLLRVSVKNRAEAPTVLASLPQVGMAGLTIDGAYVYVAGQTCRNCSTSPGSGIARIPKTGGPVSWLFTASDSHYATTRFAVDACDIYWVAEDNTVHRKPKSSF